MDTELLPTHLELLLKDASSFVEGVSGHGFKDPILDSRSTQESSEIATKRELLAALAAARKIAQKSAAASILEWNRRIGRWQLWQRYISLLHFVSTAAILTMLNRAFPEMGKVVAALVAFAAGVIALCIPKDLSKQIVSNKDAVEQLSKQAGEIARLETELSYKNPRTDKQLCDRISKVICESRTLASRLDLQSNN